MHALRRYSTSLAKSSVILPQEPFVYGVSHIPTRTVPPHILQPSYVSHGSNFRENAKRLKIELGSEDETRLRNAAVLAKNVRNYVSSLIQVRSKYRRRLNNS